MEKYTKWADRGTGVNPFIPCAPKLPHGGFARVGAYLFAIFLSALRIPVALACLLLAYGAAHLPLFLGMGAAYSSIQGWTPVALLTCGALAIMECIKPVRRHVRRFLVYSLVKLSLLVMGVRIVEKHADMRRLGLLKGHNSGLPAVSKASYPKAKGGEVIISNHTSFVEVLYLWARLDPILTLCNEKGDVASAKFKHALSQSLSSKRKTLMSPGSQSISSIIEASIQQDRPISLFPEVVRTNGQGILQFSPVLHGLEKVSQEGNVFVVAFYYECATRAYSPVHPVGNWLSHLFWLCSNTSTSTMNVVFVDKTEVTVCAKLRASAWAEEVRGLLASMTHVKKLQVGAGAYESFVGQYFAESIRAKSK